ncbi:dirigent protein 1 [Brachypodium distachyon]|uniref:Dirigent protein n=1 Tax=Brachypodium distachyon TaxID=15368 RepID=I1IMP7_BRADI|nr:dirigent protein 1 [Brachypodium distachyon]KQJ89017.1 hypothetical protein BRADI_4g22810v3 [Brachypodium distachyon]|eukprot:XP_003576189.1 dirigent protein 1 [Brachypodium distachyon]
MASSVSWILVVSSALLAASSYYYSHRINVPSIPTTTTTHLHFYMHDVYTGPHPTAALIVAGRDNNKDNATPGEKDNNPRRFGDIAVMNNVLTEGPEPGSARVGKAQGFTVRVAEGGTVNALSLHLVLETGEYAGSSLAVQGRVDTDTAVRESVIVGGTGRFRLARGYAHSRSYDYDVATGGVVEIDVYLQLLLDLGA